MDCRRSSSAVGGSLGSQPAGVDFRLDDPSLYPQWYGAPHTAPDLLERFVYGLPELFRPQLVGAALVAAPGCYVTTATLALAPLVAAGLIEAGGIIVDAASGVSGAGRPPKDNTTFCAVDEDFTAYGLLDHRHTPEIEMAVGRHADRAVQVLFTPHLAPMNRGILATCYGRPTNTTSTAELLECLAQTVVIRAVAQPPNEYLLRHTVSSLSSHGTAHPSFR